MPDSLNKNVYSEFYHRKQLQGEQKKKMKYLLKVSLKKSYIPSNSQQFQAPYSSNGRSIQEDIGKVVAVQQEHSEFHMGWVIHLTNYHLSVIPNITLFIASEPTKP